MKIEDAIDDMRLASDAGQLFFIYSKAVNTFGYDQVLLALLSDHPRLQQSAQHGILSSYPEDWVAYYLSQGYDEIDPVRKEAKRQIAPFTWKQLQLKKGLTVKQLLLFEEAADAQLYGGLGMPLHGPEGTSAGIGLASSSKGVACDQQSLWSIYNLSVQFYANYWRLNETTVSRMRRINLTSRENEVLQWLATGLTKAEIADKLTISHHTVDYHTRRLLDKFRARSVTAAVHFATAQGYIKLG
jgi:DNA-binding CsgD family transcriptional regulator